MYGEKDIYHMNLDELQALENNLEIWVHNIRSTKVRFMFFSAHAHTKKESENITFHIMFFSAEQMHIMSREIEMLKKKVGSIENFIPLMSFLSLNVER